MKRTLWSARSCSLSAASSVLWAAASKPGTPAVSNCLFEDHDDDEDDEEAHDDEEYDSFCLQLLIWGPVLWPAYLKILPLLERVHFESWGRNIDRNMLLQNLKGCHAFTRSGWRTRVGGGQSWRQGWGQRLCSGKVKLGGSSLSGKGRGRRRWRSLRGRSLAAPSQSPRQ